MILIRKILNLSMFLVYHNMWLRTCAISACFIILLLPSHLYASACYNDREFASLTSQKLAEARERFEFNKVAVDVVISPSNKFVMGLKYPDNSYDVLKACTLISEAVEEEYIVDDTDHAISYYNDSIKLKINSNEEYFIRKKLSADHHNDRVAQYETARCYYRGIGVGENYDLAFQYCLKSAEQDWGPAQNMIGFLYYSGIGTIANLNLSRQWYQHAADNNIAEAQYNLGRMCRMGCGGPQDLLKGQSYLVAAAQQCDSNAFFEIGVMYDLGQITGDGVNFSAPNVIKAFKCYKRAADLGHVLAQFNVGQMLRYGIGVKIDTQAALFYLNKAVAQNDIKAIHALEEIKYLSKMISAKNNKSTGGRIKKVIKKSKMSPVVSKEYLQVPDSLRLTAYCNDQERQIFLKKNN